MIKLILMAALLLVSGASMAQKVVVGKNSEAIIDCRDMPAKSITQDKKALLTKSTATTMGPNDLSNLSSAESNKTVSHYFQVMKSNIGTIAGVPWLDAVNSCKNHDNGDHNNTWRAPTQRELMLIWILHEPLKKVSGFTPYTNTANYWSATDLSPKDASYVGFIGTLPGLSGLALKTAVSIMRCVRDLDPQN